MLAYAFENIDTESIPSIVAYRLKQAITLRSLLLLPNASTTAYRLVNSEGDGLSGLTIDRFNDVIVVSSTAYWVQAHKESISSMIREQLSPQKIIWLAQSKPLTQDGWLQAETNDASGTELVWEAGISYQVDFSNTQKTISI